MNLDSQPVKPPKGGIVSLGCFDGIHLGHQKIISLMNAQARKRNLKTALYLFYPHPFQVLNPKKPFQRLLSLRELKSILKNCSLDFVGVIAFSKSFSLLSPREFVQSFIGPQLRPKMIVAGYDFSFGRCRKGDISDLKSFGKEEKFEVIQAPAHLVSGSPVSTSRIKEALCLGQAEEAARLFGRPFFLMAPVVKGQGRGRKLGYPTANLSVAKDKFLPKKGVYSARIRRKGQMSQPAVLNIGHRPTFGDSEKVTVEAHILNGPVESLYHRTLKVEIQSFLREERAFKNSSQLQRQIQKDVQMSLNNLSR